MSHGFYRCRSLADGDWSSRETSRYILALQDLIWSW
jgi:hypothetical protein